MLWFLDAEDVSLFMAVLYQLIAMFACLFQLNQVFHSVLAKTYFPFGVAGW